MRNTTQNNNIGLYNHIKFYKNNHVSMSQTN